MAHLNFHVLMDMLGHRNIDSVNILHSPMACALSNHLHFPTTSRAIKRLKSSGPCYKYYLKTRKMVSIY